MEKENAATVDKSCETDNRIVIDLDALLSALNDDHVMEQLNIPEMN